ncbi:MAG: hypothetical protein RTU92_03980 [Candidatus Thorarchaeota archaeon]
MIHDLLVLLRLDLRQTFRLTRARGKRTEGKSTLRRLVPVIGVCLLAIAIILIILFLVPPFWSEIAVYVTDNPGFGATIFNAILLFGFVGSIMISSATVGNSAKMEYLMVMPLQLRTIFMEKMVVIIIYSSLLWLVIGVPIFIGFSIVSTATFAFLSIPVFAVMLLTLTTLGVSFGGLLGLVFSRLLANRRTLKQVGYAILTASTILISTLWYLSIYMGNGGASFFLDSIFAVAESFGFSSSITPGYATSAVSLNLLVGAPIALESVLALLVSMVLAGVLLYTNALVSEEAHYSGWLYVKTKRGTKEYKRTAHTNWDPIRIPWFKLSSTTSVSMWYNIASVRREARVFTQYLLGPLRFAIWMVFPMLIGGDELLGLTPLFLVALLIPFATSYGLYFAGYELVYEGKNLMNLQLASANMDDYIKGKVLSAVPFSMAAGVVVSFVLLFLAPPVLWSYIPLLIISAGFITMASGAISSNAAAMGGDFKAQRMMLRQRGASVQMPIRGWSILRAQLLPYLIAYVGVFAMIGIGLFLGALYAYLGLPVFALICVSVYGKNTHRAGVRISQIEASDYL